MLFLIQDKTRFGTLEENEREFMRALTVSKSAIGFGADLF